MTKSILSLFQLHVTRFFTSIYVILLFYFISDDNFQMISVMTYILLHSPFDMNGAFIFYYYSNLFSFKELQFQNIN